MDIAVRTKFGDGPGAKEKVAGGFCEVAVAQRNREISGLTKMGPNTIHATLSAVELPDRFAGLIDQSDPGTHQLGVGMSTEMGDATGKPFRMITIIRIEHTDEIAIFGQLEAARNGCMRSLIFLFDKVDPRIFDGADDFDRIIPGTVVDNHQSLRWKRLSDYRKDCFRDITSVVIRRDNAGDFLAHW